MQSIIEQAFKDSASVKLQFVSTYRDQIALVAQKIIEAVRGGRKLLLFGNGGSATDASHIAAEFVGRYTKDRTPLAAIALTTDQSVITSVGNDLSFSEIFARQVQALGRPGDIAIAISTSGNSPNVLKAVEAAKKSGLLTIGFTGGSGGKLAGMVDHAFIVPSKVTARIQETHITLGHVICGLVEETLFGPS
jgi:D-sedoheptulose 7-phosphate isomerase